MQTFFQRSGISYGNFIPVEGVSFLDTQLLLTQTVKIPERSLVKKVLDKALCHMTNFFGF